MRFVGEKIGVALASATLIATAMAACGGGGNDNAAPRSPDAGEASTIDAPEDTGSLDAGAPDGDASVSPAFVRFAWFVGGGSAAATPLAFDVCIAPHGTGAFAGPLLAASGYAAGLQPFDVTTYVSVTPGVYDARIVPAGSATCSSPDAGVSDDFTSLPAFAAGQTITAVFVDPRAPASIADVFTFTDDTSAPAGEALVRFVNVSENDLVTPITDDAGDDAGATVTGADLGIGSGVLFTSMFTDVLSQQGIDPTAVNGYRAIAPLSGVDMTMRPPGSNLEEGQLGTGALTLPAGGLFTAFYATEANGGSSQPVLVWCHDGQPSGATSHLTRCAYADTTSDALLSMTRFGNFLVDGASTDICVKYDSYGGYVGPLGMIYGAGAGDASTPIPSESLSAYYFLTGGLTFDARFVNGGATDCTTSVADTTFVAALEPNGGGFTSLLLTGYDAIPSDAGAVPPYDAGPPFDGGEDGGDAGPQPVSLGVTSLAKTVVRIEDEVPSTPNLPALRLVHVDAANAPPIAITVTAQLDGGTEAWTIDDVPYGGFSTRPGPMDPYGYELMVAGSVTVAWSGGDAPYTMAKDQTTMFAFGDPQKGLQLLACDDFAEDWYFNGVLYADCCVVGAEDCGGDAVNVLPRARAARRAPLTSRTTPPRRPTSAHPN